MITDSRSAPSRVSFSAKYSMVANFLWRSPSGISTSLGSKPATLSDEISFLLHFRRTGGTVTTNSCCRRPESISRKVFPARVSKPFSIHAS